MKDHWETYLNTVEIRGLFLDRVKEVIGFYEQICPDIENIFITEYIDKEGARQYESLWLFSPTRAFEAKKFLTEDSYDASPLKDKVRYWLIKKVDYDFRKATTQSRMIITVGLIIDNVCSLRASRENCDYLRDIFLKYFDANMLDASTEAAK